jgi:rRNA processing protein Gar1
MSGHKSRRSRSKRRQVEGHGDDEEIIDDLAYAATFAMMGPPVTSPTVRKNDDENEGDEIEIDEKESEAEEENDHAETETVQSPPKEYSKAAEKEHDEDDDDVELNIAEMEDEMEEELVDGKNKPNTNHAPKTEHEVDAYKTPIQELEQHLQFSLTVDQGSTKTSRSMNSANLILAGTIKHFMINDRTVVVESNPPVNGSSLTPLDEGSLLVLKHRENLIPLGRIFEVFGPVSQPLYTIRLPAPTSVITNPKTAATPKERQDKKYLQGESTEEPERDQISPGPENYDDVGDTKDLNNTMKTPADSQIDHWAPDGKYSLLLKSNDAISVCFVQDEAKLIDTTFILRSSGKGCGMFFVFSKLIQNYRSDIISSHSATCFIL